jgi:hypothetical protein
MNRLGGLDVANGPFHLGQGGWGLVGGLRGIGHGVVGQGRKRVRYEGERGDLPRDNERKGLYLGGLWLALSYLLLGDHTLGCGCGRVGGFMLGGGLGGMF